MKIVIDTNDFISAMIGKKHREKLTTVLERKDISIFADDNLKFELEDVAYRDKFKKYVTKQEIDIYLELLSLRFTNISTKTVVQASPDPDDNLILALAVDSESEFLITGNKKDLLDLNPFQGIQIIKLDEFIEKFI